MSKGKQEIELPDIFGISTWSTDGYRSAEATPAKACRIVLKAAKTEIEYGTINLKSSLLKK